MMEPINLPPPITPEKTQTSKYVKYVIALCVLLIVMFSLTAVGNYLRAKYQAEREAAKQTETAKRSQRLQRLPPRETLSVQDQEFRVYGEVVASNPRSISIRTIPEKGKPAEIINIYVGLKTKFIPFRRPVPEELVKITYFQDNDASEKFGNTVEVIP